MEENKINIEEPVVETEEAAVEAAEAVKEIVADKAEEAADIFNEAVKEAAEIEEEVVSPTDEQEEFVGEAEEAAEEVKAITDNIVNKIKEVLADGNVTFIRIRKDDNVILNLPMTAGIIGTVVGLVAAPWAIILATISTIGLKCIVEVEKKDGTIGPIPATPGIGKDERTPDKNKRLAHGEPLIIIFSAISQSRRRSDSTSRRSR